MESTIKIVMVSSGQAVEKGEGVVDLERVLTEQGRQTAGHRKSLLGHPKFDLVLFSPAICTHQTAVRIMGDETDHSRMVILPELYIPQGEVGEVAKTRKALESMYERRRGKSIVQYASEDDFPLLRYLGRKAWANIVVQIAGLDKGKVLVVSHDFILPAIAIGASPLLAVGIQHIAVAECGGYEIVLDGLSAKTIKWLDEQSHHTESSNTERRALV